MSTKAIQLTDGTDNILPVSADSGSGYCKMADGTLICWGRYTFSDQSTSQRGSLYIVNFNVNIPFPIVFNSTPTVVGTVGRNGNEGFLKSFSFSTSAITGFAIARLTDDKVYANDVNWIAIGRWK